MKIVLNNVPNEVISLITEDALLDRKVLEANLARKDCVIEKIEIKDNEKVIFLARKTNNLLKG